MGEWTNADGLPKVLHLSTSLEPGAGGATRRLHDGLRSIGVPSRTLVQKKTCEDPTVIRAARTAAGRWWAPRRKPVDRLPLRLYPDCKGNHDPQWLPEGIPRRVARLRPDVVNLHWICGGFVRIESIARLEAPLVWTLHDMWAFTGGCHYSQGCTGYEGRCGSCPVLGSQRERDLSRWVWERKHEAWRELNAVIVTPSSWLARCASSSSLLGDHRIETIPNGLDTTVFAPTDRHTARSALSLPQNKKLVLFAASTVSKPEKGFHLLLEALQTLSDSPWRDDLELLVLGSLREEIAVPLGSHRLGRLSSGREVALAYAAADAMVVPSRWDNLPQTAVEATACGTPVVAFDGPTGLPDIVEHTQTGYLAAAGDVKDLARGIVWVIEDPQRRQRLSESSRKKAEREYTLEVQARRYLDLYEEVLETERPLFSRA